MLDLDQLRSSEQKSVAIADLIWANDELFNNEWLDFAVQEQETDFWSGMLDDLPLLK